MCKKKTADDLNEVIISFSDSWWHLLKIRNAPVHKDLYATFLSDTHLLPGKEKPNNIYTFSSAVLILWNSGGFGNVTESKHKFGWYLVEQFSSQCDGKEIYGSLFPLYGIKKKVLSHNCDYFLAILRKKVRIVRYKLFII